MKNSNYVDINDVVQIKDCETVLVAGGRGEETAILITDDKKPFGLNVKIVCLGELNEVMQLCRKSGFPNHYICASLNRDGERYFSQEGCDGGKTLCVKEMEENGEFHLKLCYVFAKELVMEM